MNDQGLGSYLDCSTIHLKPETMEELVNGELGTCYVFPEGAWVLVNMEGIDEATLPLDFYYVLQFAFANGCDWIKFDGEGKIHRQLYKFDWK